MVNRPSAACPCPDARLHNVQQATAWPDTRVRNVQHASAWPDTRVHNGELDTAWPVTRVHNLQAKVPATVHLLEAIRHIRHFLIDKVFKETLYPLANIHMEHINVLNFDDKSERNLCFSFGNLGIIFNGVSAQLFPPGRNGNSAGSEVTRRPMAAEINRCRLIDADCRVHSGRQPTAWPVPG